MKSVLFDVSASAQGYGEIFDLEFVTVRSETVIPFRDKQNPPLHTGILAYTFFLHGGRM